MPDDDGDTLNATEEKLNGLSPQARNALVPSLQMSVTPVGEIPDARPGSFWLPGTNVSINIELINIAVTPVTTTLSLTLPGWFDSISGGSLTGDRTPPMVLNGNTLSWDFSGSNALQLYEAVSTTVTARVNPEALSGYDDIKLDLLYGAVQMHKTVLATVDGDNPALSMIAPSNGAYLNGTSYVVGGTTVDRTTWITERSLSIVSQGSTPNFQTLPLGQGPWAYTWALPTTDGIYTLQARATDAMNHSATSSQVNVTVDNTPPTITLNWEMLGSTVKLSGWPTDNLAGVEWVQLKIDGQPWRNVPLTGIKLVLRLGGGRERAGRAHGQRARHRPQRQPERNGQRYHRRGQYGALQHRQRGRRPRHAPGGPGQHGF